MVEAKGHLITHLKMGTGRRINEMGLWNFADVDPENFRRLAVLVNYSNFAIHYDFRDIVRTLTDQFCRNNRVTETYFYKPERRQVLGRLRELKVDHFLKMWDEVALRGDFDFFEYMKHADIWELMYRHKSRMVLPVYGMDVRLRKDQSFMLQSACTASKKLSRFHLALPSRISERLSDSSYELEDLPF